MDALESRDIYEIILERHQRALVVLTSNRAPVEWLAMMADWVRAHSAVDRLHNAAYELVIRCTAPRRVVSPAAAVSAERQ